MDEEKRPLGYTAMREKILEIQSSRSGSPVDNESVLSFNSKQ